MSLPWTVSELAEQLSRRNGSNVGMAEYVIATLQARTAVPEIADEALDAVLTEWFRQRADAIREVAAHRASPPEYPGMALVPVAALDRLAVYVDLPLAAAPQEPE